MALLEVDNLSVNFQVGAAALPAVSEVSFQLESHEILALVGESGCGKSVTCLSLARLLPEPPAQYAGGGIRIQDGGEFREILELSNRELRKIRGGRIAYIFQEPGVSLNPVFRVGDQIAEAILLHRKDVTDVRGEIISLLAQVGIPDPEARISAYPHEMSGGMQQRVMIAMALASRPEILVADEPTTALDVTIQAQILNLLKQLGRDTGMAIILVTHNLGIVAEMADRVVVMYAGHAVEAAPVGVILEQPLHPYTVALLKAVPKLNHPGERLTTIPGRRPAPRQLPARMPVLRPLRALQRTPGIRSETLCGGSPRMAGNPSRPIYAVAGTPKKLDFSTVFEYYSFGDKQERRKRLKERHEKNSHMAGSQAHQQTENCWQKPHTPDHLLFVDHSAHDHPDQHPSRKTRSSSTTRTNCSLP